MTRRNPICWSVCVLVTGVLLGCGGSPKSRNTAPKAKPAKSSAADSDRIPPKEKPNQGSSAKKRGEEEESAFELPWKNATGDQTPAPGDQANPDGSEDPLLGELLGDAPDSPNRMIPNVPRIKVNESLASDQGIRKVASRRMTLYTDLPPGEEVDILPEVFKQAFPQWCAYFGVSPEDHADWHLTGFLIKDKARFQRAGLIPRYLPPFKHGYARNYGIWLYDQPSDYYRRHLFLHEGTHGFMNTVLGGCGPPWYMEGMAELMATHRWSDGRLTMGYFPANREEVPMLGRIRIIKDALAAGRARGLLDVVQYSSSAHLDTEPYAWCWALAMLLDRHPQYRERFRDLHKLVRKPDFNRRFYQIIDRDMRPLDEQWQVFAADLEYGTDVERSAIEFRPGSPLPDEGATVTVSADRGWQSSGVQLQGGRSYQIVASGRYQVADQPQIWWCEPGGVSIRYYRGQPLGILLGAVRNEAAGNTGPSPLLWPTTIGLQSTLTPEKTGTLYLRINDSTAELQDNAGTLEVRIRPAKTVSGN